VATKPVPVPISEERLIGLLDGAADEMSRVGDSVEQLLGMLREAFQLPPSKRRSHLSLVPTTDDGKES
jgi:hypothetical protein